MNVNDACTAPVRPRARQFQMIFKDGLDPGDTALRQRTKERLEAS